MKERPLLFNGDMVRALLAGTKTQTRRAVKWRGVEPGLNLQFSGLSVERSGSNWVLSSPTRDSHAYRSVPMPCPYGQPGDRLWVREAHWWFKDDHDPVTGYFPPKLTVEDVEYRADGDDGRKVWRPSIHMPRWASRLTLEITDVRVERLQDISEADAQAEGGRAVHFTHGSVADRGLLDLPLMEIDNPYRNGYALLWETINGDGSWAANPWVWAVSFKAITP